MPKRVGHLYEQMLDKTFIKDIILEAAKGRHKRFDVKPVIKNVDHYVDLIYEMLRDGTYVPTKPKIREIWDVSSEKWRKIQILPFFPDGIIQWLIVTVMKPVMLRGMYHWSCASLPGRGGRRVREYTERILEEDPYNTQYAEELDIKQYYPSVEIDRLMNWCAHKIKDKKFLRLIRAILESSCDVINGVKKGIAIGFYLNQWLANFFLESLDIFITRIHGVKYFTRYMDNINLYSYSKECLHKARILIQSFLATKLGLTLKRTWQVFPTAARKISAVGYRFKAGLTILRKRNLLRILRQCRRLHGKLNNGKVISFGFAAGLLSRAGQLKHCYNKTVYDNYLSQDNIIILKEVVSNESKRKCRAQQRVSHRAAA